jgi:succinyl-CoA synthetase beta subunit/citryl-CoA synthetase large subunit
LLRLGVVITTLIERFLEWDALLLEVNPLIIGANGQWWVADVHLETDDDAAFRQSTLLSQLPLSRREADRRSEFERQAAEIDSADHRGVAGRLVPFGGDLGLLIGGGGASLTIMDAVLDAGLKPANYCEIGGNPSVWKVKELTKLILSQPGVTRLAVIMNVVSNTRVDLVARGVIKGVLELGYTPREVITVFRIPGSWEEEGKSILRHYDVPFYDRDTSIDQVVEAIQWRS